MALLRSAPLVLTALLPIAAGADTVARPEPCRLRVLLPHAAARLTVDGAATRQTGRERLFESPPLEPGEAFTYTLVATWEPNNYTRITRTREAAVRAGARVEVDLRRPDPDRKDEIVIRFVPTPEDIVDEMCRLAKVGQDDVVHDLGCGDGRMVIRAVKAFGARRGVGVDIDPERVAEARANAEREGVADRVLIRQGDVLKIDDVSDATVVLLYMADDLNNAIKPVLRRTLRPGARVVSHRFLMGDWQPTKSVTVRGHDGDDYELHLWVIGDKPPPAPGNGSRRR